MSGTLGCGHGAFSRLLHCRGNALRIQTEKEKNEMKRRKTAAVLSLLLALSICLSACGGDTAEPSSGSAAEEVSDSVQDTDTTAATGLSDE